MSEQFQKTITEFIKAQQVQAQLQQDQLMKNQQEFLLLLSQNFKSSGVPPKTAEVSEEFRMETLGNGITEFHYDPENNVTFEAWYQRYESLFLEDAQKLSDPAKVRLLLRKLDTQVHQQYINLILPKEPKEINFKDTIAKLTEMFGRKTSIFNTRYQCMKLTKNSADDFVAYAAKVNKFCEDFDIRKITVDQFKCLIFVCGLQSGNDSDVRTKLLSKIDGKDSESLKLQDLTSECQRILNLKQDTAMIEHSNTSVVNAISQKKKYSSTKKSHDFSKNNHKEPNYLSNGDIPKTACWFCGQMHFAKNCTYQNHTCQNCRKVGHKEGFCGRMNKKRNYKRFNRSNIISQVNSITERKYLQVIINGVQVKLQIDTASDITIVSEETWIKLGKPQCFPTQNLVKNASGQQLPLISEFTCNIVFNNQSYSGKCYVTTVKQLNLLGIDWITKFGLWDIPLNSICNVMSLSENDMSLSVTNINIQSVSQLQKKFPDIFDNSLGLCKKMKVELHVSQETKPVFRPKRPVAYAALTQVEEELNRLQNLDIISPVDYSEWAAPIVATKKANGSIRICGDYSTGLNDALQPHQFPLPTPDEIFSRLANSKIFSVIDLSDAFLQVEVHENSRKYLTINTHKGLFSYNRLPFGIKVAPTLFQQIMETMISGLEGTAAYIDDIIVSGKTAEEHQQNLLNVLQRIREFGFHLKIQKCKFNLPEIKYLGNIINQHGIQPDPTRIEAVIHMPSPHDISTLRSYLGAINYYGKFVRNMHELRKPFDQLLKKNVKWKWSSECQQSFDKFKEILQSNLLLTHYNPELPIVVAADASNSGIGSCIFHKFQDGSMKAIYHASRSLTDTEKKYSQIEKEALALVFAAKKFHRMIYGRPVIFQSDHKPLLAIFGSKKGIPVHTANRLQRYALIMKAYDFQIEYIKTEDFGHADILSRLINSDAVQDEEYVISSIRIESEVLQVLNIAIEPLPITHRMIQQATSKCRTLQKIIEYVQNDTWPRNVKMNKELKSFYDRRENLSVVDECLMFAERVVVPENFKHRILHQLHKGHPGQERMKSLARSYVYWKNIDADIQDFVRKCSSCAEAAKSPPKIPFSPWSTPKGPWHRLHIDFAGPINGDSFFIIVDAYSKWPEIVSTRNTTTTFIIGTLEEIFARFGNPQILVSDNASQFCSEHFQIFCKQNGIEHIRTPPYHPQSNGQVERFVDTFKRALKKIGKGGQPLGQQIQTFLATYRTTPSRYTPNGTSPAEVLIGRKVRTTLDLLLPSSREGVHRDDDNHPISSKSFEIGDVVYCQVHCNNKYQWKPGRITGKIGNVMYELSLKNSQRILRAHANQLKRRYTECSEIENEPLPLDILMESFEISRKPRENIPSTSSAEPIDIPPNLSVELIPEVIPDNVIHESQEKIEVSTEPQREVRPSRTKRIPSYLNDFELRRGDVGNT